MCICGAAIDNCYPGGHRSFCSGTCANRAVLAVVYAERAQALLAGLIISASADPEAYDVLRELRLGLADVRKGPHYRHYEPGDLLTIAERDELAAKR